MTTALRNIEARYQRAAARAEALRLERNDAVRDALAAGRTHADVARELGVTRGRVGQLAMSFHSPTTAEGAQNVD